MVHRRPLLEDLTSAPNVRPVRADLRDPATLRPALAGSDVVVHFAGVLFAPRPERFLPETNTLWFSNLLTAALEANVKKVILISFPHVEGITSIEEPATGRLIEAARWLARRRPLAVWPEPTWYQLVSLRDCLRAIEAAILRPNVQGIYHVGDEQPVTLQHFLDEACRAWELPRPRRLPFPVIQLAAGLCEGFAMLAGTPPL
jgi:nucleoside-diphosphate-sugar epimerase